MTEATNPRPDILLRRWLPSLPGSFDGPSAQSCYRESHIVADVADYCSVSEWTDALRRSGFTAKEIRPGLYRLRLPEKSAGQTGRPYRG